MVSDQTAVVQQVQPERLNKTQYNLLLYFEQTFWRTGSLPTLEAMQAEGFEISQAFWDSCLQSPLFHKALAGRGLPDAGDYLKAGEVAGQGAVENQTQLGFQLNAKVLTEEQITVANVMLDVHDKRSRLKKLTELGISTSVYNSWLRDPKYRAYCLDRAEDLLIQNQAVAHMSLINNVERGDLSSIKYFNSMTGRFREKTAAGVEVNVQNNHYGSDTLIKVVEIIQKHVKDPATLDAIASDILALTRNETAPVPTLRGELGV